MYDDQLAAPNAEARKTILSQMQNQIYDQAVYDILYYDANLEAWRTDRFAGWENQPASNGTPFFTYSTLDYTQADRRQDRAVRGPVDAAASGPPDSSGSPTSSSAAVEPSSPTASAAPGSVDSGSSSNTTPILIGIVALIAVVAVGIGLSRRRSASAAATEEDE